MTTATAQPVVDPLREPDMDRLYSAGELLHFPKHWHYELVGGRLRKLNMPTGRPHGARTNRLGTAISTFVYDGDLGECFAAETGFLIARDPDTVKAPDFAFVAANRLPAEESAGFVPVVPDLVLETRSSSDRGPAVAEKVQEWRNAGVRLVLDLDPARRTLTVYRPSEEPITLGPEDTLEGYDVLPGLSIPLRRIFG